MRLRRFCLFGLLAVCFGAPQMAQAHEVRPGYLELNALGGDVWDVLWKVPAKGDRRLGLYVQLPEGCEVTEPAGRLLGAAYVERWHASCDDGLVGKTIRIEGLAATRTDVLVRLKRLDGCPR